MTNLAAAHDRVRVHVRMFPQSRKLSKDVRGYVQKCEDKGKEINRTCAVIKDTIMRGLHTINKYIMPCMRVVPLDSRH